MDNSNKLLDDNRKRSLVVEGPDDFHVVTQLRIAFSLLDNFSIIYSKSNNQALEKFNALVSTSGQESLGLVLDTDETGVERRWASVRGKLGRYESYYQFPGIPSTDGTIVLPQYPNKPRLGIWFMPNNQDCGMLEDLCLEMADPCVRKAAEEAVTFAKDQGVTRFRDVHRSKAVIHTYLAWQEKPGKPLGVAIKAKYLSVEQNTAQAFADWLRELFADPV
jgi:hypothetical protein